MPGSSNGSEPTPPSAPSSAPEPPAPRRGGGLLVAVSAAALASAWNPLGAPFALVAGVLCAVLAVRALVRGARRTLAALALALGAGAALASGMVLLAGAGLGARPAEKLDVEPRPPQEVRRALDDAATRSEAARRRARRELDELPAQGDARPSDASRAVPPRKVTPPGDPVR